VNPWRIIGWLVLGLLVWGVVASIIILASY